MSRHVQQSQYRLGSALTLNGAHDGQDEEEEEDGDDDSAGVEDSLQRSHLGGGGGGRVDLLTRPTVAQQSANAYAFMTTPDALPAHPPWEPNARQQRNAVETPQAPSQQVAAAAGLPPRIERIPAQRPAPALASPPAFLAGPSRLLGGAAGAAGAAGAGARAGGMNLFSRPPAPIHGNNNNVGDGGSGGGGGGNSSLLADDASISNSFGFAPIPPHRGATMLGMFQAPPPSSSSLLPSQPIVRRGQASPAQSMPSAVRRPLPGPPNSTAAQFADPTTTPANLDAAAIAAERRIREHRAASRSNTAGYAGGDDSFPTVPHQQRHQLDRSVAGANAAAAGAGVHSGGGGRRSVSFSNITTPITATSAAPAGGGGGGAGAGGAMMTPDNFAPPARTRNVGPPPLPPNRGMGFAAQQHMYRNAAAAGGGGGDDASISHLGGGGRTATTRPTQMLIQGGTYRDVSFASSDSLDHSSRPWLGGGGFGHFLPPPQPTRLFAQPPPPQRAAASFPSSSSTQPPLNASDPSRSPQAHAPPNNRVSFSLDPFTLSSLVSSSSSSSLSRSVRVSASASASAGGGGGGGGGEKGTRTMRLRKWDGSEKTVAAYVVSDSAEGMVEEEQFDYDTVVRFDIAAVVSGHRAAVDGRRPSRRARETKVGGMQRRGHADEAQDESVCAAADTEGEGERGVDALQSILEIQLGLRGLHGWFGHTYSNPLTTTTTPTGGKAPSLRDVVANGVDPSSSSSSSLTDTNPEKSTLQQSQHSNQTDGRTSRKRRRLDSSSLSSPSPSPSPSSSSSSSSTQTESPPPHNTDVTPRTEGRMVVVYDAFGRVKGTITLPSYTSKGGPAFPLPSPLQTCAIRHSAAATQVLLYGTKLAARETSLLAPTFTGAGHRDKMKATQPDVKVRKTRTSELIDFQRAHQTRLLKGLQNAYTDSFSFSFVHHHR